MRATQSIWRSKEGWNRASAAPNTDAGLVLAFGSADAVSNGGPWPDLMKQYPNAIVLGCSTGGEIYGNEVMDETLSATALEFSKTEIRPAEANVADGGSFGAGTTIGAKLAHPDLRAIFVLSDGTQVNGSDLVRGLRATVDPNVVLTGGLAGDGARFGTTYVGLNSQPTPGKVAAVGFYGEAFQVGHGSGGGWDVFGPERRITLAKANVLHELDGQPALDLYKRYLGEEAAALPGSALLFPLRVYPPDKPEHAIVRTVVGIDEATRTMTFAGDMPNGFCAQLMRGNFDRLVQSAGLAAKQANTRDGGGQVAILVSCIGRKLLLGQRIQEEVEAVHAVLGAGAHLTGFYSYGELSPHSVTGCAELHNQTMTITVLGESGSA